jgi:hypothetical protein
MGISKTPVQTSLQTSVPGPPRSRSFFLSENEAQQLWFATLRQPWSSLVVIPADSKLSGMVVARALAEVGGLHRGSPIQLISAENLDIAAASRLIIEMTSRVAGGNQVIVAIDSVLSNSTGIPVALAADAALLCVGLGETEFRSARRTLDLVGKNRFLGSVTLPSNPLK